MKHLPDAQGANLRGMNLSRIYLEGFSGLTFEAADMRQVNLSHACIVHGGTNMQKVNLEGADLSYAVLDSVNLNEAYLQGANLDHAKNIHGEFHWSGFAERFVWCVCPGTNRYEWCESLRCRF